MEKSEVLAKEVLHSERNTSGMPIGFIATDLEFLARFILRALPVLRQVDHWRDRGDGQGHCDEEACKCSTQLLREAVDAFRRGEK